MFEQYDYRMAQIASDAAVAVQPAVEQGPNIYMETDDLEAALERVKELKELGARPARYGTFHPYLRPNCHRRNCMVASLAVKTVLLDFACLA